MGSRKSKLSQFSLVLISLLLILSISITESQLITFDIMKDKSRSIIIDEDNIPFSVGHQSGMVHINTEYYVNITIINFRDTPQNIIAVFKSDSYHLMFDGLHRFSYNITFENVDPNEERVEKLTIIPSISLMMTAGTQQFNATAYYNSVSLYNRLSNTIEREISVISVQENQNRINNQNDIKYSDLIYGNYNHDTKGLGTTTNILFFNPENYKLVFEMRSFSIDGKRIELGEAEQTIVKPDKHMELHLIWQLHLPSGFSGGIGIITTEIYIGFEDSLDTERTLIYTIYTAIQTGNINNPYLVPSSALVTENDDDTAILEMKLELKDNSNNPMINSISNANNVQGFIEIAGELFNMTANWLDNNKNVIVFVVILGAVALAGLGVISVTGLALLWTALEYGTTAYGLISFLVNFFRDIASDISDTSDGAYNFFMLYFTIICLPLLYSKKRGLIINEFH